MATRYWVAGGTGSWNSTTNWSDTSGGTSGFSIPVSWDTAIFNAASGAFTVTLDISPTVAILNCTDFTGTLAFNANTITLDGSGTIFLGSTTMSITGTPLIICSYSGSLARTLSPKAMAEANSISFNITAGDGSVSLANNSSFRDVNFTGFGGSLAATDPDIYGSLTLSTTMSVSSGGTLTFKATSGVKTIDGKGITVDKNITFDGAGGIWQLSSDLTLTASRTTTLTAGTLITNNQGLTTGIFNSNNSNVRACFSTPIGGLVIIGRNTTIVNLTNCTNFTGGGAMGIAGVGVAGETRTILGPSTGGTATNTFSIDINDGADIIDFSSEQRAWGTIFFRYFTGSLASNTDFTCYGDLGLYGGGEGDPGMTVTGGAGANWKFASTSGSSSINTKGVAINNKITLDAIGGAWTWVSAGIVAGSVTLANGTLKLTPDQTLNVSSFTTTGTNQKYLLSAVPGIQANMSDYNTGTNTATYLTIQDSGVFGVINWRASTGCINAGNNTGWIFTTTSYITGVQASGAVGNVYTGWYTIQNNQSPAWTNITQS